MFHLYKAREAEWQCTFTDEPYGAVGVNTNSSQTKCMGHTVNITKNRSNFSMQSALISKHYICIIYPRKHNGIMPLKYI